MSIFLTMDTEWADDRLIESVFNMADKVGVHLFPFVTHHSPYIWSRNEPKGIHPNFLPGSTHGKTEDEVIQHMFDLVPEARTYRSHCLYDHTRLQWKMLGHGVKADSNGYDRWGQTYQTAAGLWRYPIFWADDVHLRQGKEMDYVEKMIQWPMAWEKSGTPLVFDIHPYLAAGSIYIEDLFKFARGREDSFANLCR